MNRAQQAAHSHRAQRTHQRAQAALREEFEAATRGLKADLVADVLDMCGCANWRGRSLDDMTEAYARGSVLMKGALEVLERMPRSTQVNLPKDARHPPYCVTLKNIAPAGANSTWAYIAHRAADYASCDVRVFEHAGSGASHPLRSYGGRTFALFRLSDVTLKDVERSFEWADNTQSRAAQKQKDNEELLRLRARLVHHELSPSRNDDDLELIFGLDDLARILDAVAARPTTTIAQRFALWGRK